MVSLPARGGIYPATGNGHLLPLGVIGNTPDSDSGESRFDPWRGNGRALVVGCALVVLRQEGSHRGLGLLPVTTSEWRTTSSQSVVTGEVGEWLKPTVC